MTAFWAIDGSFAISSGEAAFRVTIGWLVEGEMVVKVSPDIFAGQRAGGCLSQFGFQDNSHLCDLLSVSVMQ
jgi:hypothetical protein